MESAWALLSARAQARELLVLIALIQRLGEPPQLFLELRVSQTPIARVRRAYKFPQLDQAAPAHWANLVLPPIPPN